MNSKGQVTCLGDRRRRTLAELLQWVWIFEFFRLAVLASLCADTRAYAALSPYEVVIVANDQLPESVSLAHFYAEKRGIPSDRICRLSLPKGEMISRRLYETALRDPLLEFLRERKLIQAEARRRNVGAEHDIPWRVTGSSIRAIVLTWGVPVRIEDTRWLPKRILGDRSHRVEEKDAAAVDSELTLLFVPHYEIRGFVANPLFRRLSADQEPISVLFVTRLDGPSPEVAREIVSRSLDAEYYGVQGRGYFDAMGSRGGSYEIGDYWIREACRRFEREGYECVLDDEPRLFGRWHPMEAVAVYFGWYNESVVGPMSRDDFRFMPGTLAAHIHSASALRLRTTKDYWAGPLLARGAAVTWGAVSEPYLNWMPNLDILADRLCSGHSFGESFYMAIPVLSWQITVVGDPLYTPFRYSLDQQIEHLERDNRPEKEWAWIRRVNLLAHSGRLNIALEYARSKLAQQRSVALLEKMGDLYAINGMLKEAGECYEEVLETAPTPEMSVRVALRWLPVLRALNSGDRAAEWEKRLREKWRDSPVLLSLPAGGSR